MASGPAVRRGNCRLPDPPGAVIGGTRAGAAIMSRVMITGDQRGEPDRKAEFAVVRRGATLTSTGLGLVTNAMSTRTSSPAAARTVSSE